MRSLDLVAVNGMDARNWKSLRQECMGHERIKESPVVLGCAQVFLDCFCHLADRAFFS